MHPDYVEFTGQQEALERITVNCDQVAGIVDILERYRKVCLLRFSGISRAGDAAKIAAILELFEVLGLKPEHDAVQNVIAACPELGRMAWRANRALNESATVAERGE